MLDRVLLVVRSGRTWAAASALALAACASAGTDSGGDPMVQAPATGSGGLSGQLAGPMGGAAGAGMGGSGTTAAGMPTAGMIAPPPAGSGGSAGMAGGAAGGAGMAPIAGMTGTGVGGTGSPSDCPPAPADATPAAIAALAAVNTARVASGAGCATMIAEINTAAQNHCDYYSMNTGDCTADPHSEVSTCTGFTGQSPGARMMAAGYTGRGASEVMAFSNNPERAVAMWINSVWHRLPVLDPWTTHLGYGGAERCDTIDFGRGTPAPDDTVVVYPYDGQTGVPTEFDGSREGPEPPAPSSGWPSAAPITVYGREMVITEHVLTRDGDTTPIEHVWLTEAESNFLRTAVMMYANSAFAAATTYRVKIVGTYVGGALNLEWTFTTR